MSDRFNKQNLCMLTKFKEQLEKMETKNSVLFRKIVQKISQLKEMEASSLFAYLNSQNSKKFFSYSGETVGDLGRHIYKFRLDSGDRILYTYGKYINYLRSDYENTIILLAIASHDKQDSMSGMGQGQDVHQIGGGAGIDEVSEKDIEDFGIDPVKMLHNFSQSEYKLETADEFFIVDVNNVPEDNLELLDVMLSKEQNELIERFSRRKCPMIITGGAGTGKTLLLSHIFHNFVTINENCKSIYFTNSRLLLDNVKTKVKFIHGLYGSDDITIKPSVFFTDISTYLKNFLKDKIDQDISLVSYDEFYRFCTKDNHLVKFFADHSVKPKDIPSPYQLWTEIRGCIKGGLSSEWTRTEPINFDSINRIKLFKDNFDDLLTYGLIIDSGDGYYLFSDDIPQNFKNSRNRCFGDDAKRKFFDDLADTYQNLKNSYRKQWLKNISDMGMRDLDEYYNVMGELSDISDRHLKKVCYEFCKDYDRYFKSISDVVRLCIDDNELARLVLSQPEFMSELRGKYDLVIIDEVQDYTDVQVYLISLLARKLLIIAGDQHQIINPSFFHPDKLMYLPKIVENTEPENNEIQTLGINFRSTSIVIRLLNCLIQFRQKKIGNMEKRTENPEVILENKESLIQKFRNEIMMINSDDDDSMDSLFRIFKGHNTEFSYVAILVPDEETKKVYLKKWEFLNTMIFTLSEIKGLEYQFVICCNMISSNFDTWCRILSSQGKIKETKYRFIFNQLYVAVSRAIKSITFVESFSILSPRSNENRIRSIFNEIFGCNIEIPGPAMDWIDYITQFRINSNLSTVIKTIENLIYINKYDTALLQYIDLRSSDDISNSVKREIDRCIENCKYKYVNYLISDRIEIQEGLKYALILGYRVLLEDYVERLDRNSSLYRLIMIFLDRGYLKCQNGFNYDSMLISRLYYDSFQDFDGGVFISSDDMNRFTERFKQEFSERFQ